MKFSIQKGYRTFAFGLLTLGFLLGGYSLSVCYPTAGIAIFAAYAAACVAVLGVVAGRNLGQDAVAGDGLVEGAKRLLTPAKPPPQPGAQP